MFKVGDNMRVTHVFEIDESLGIKVGDIVTVIYVSDVHAGVMVKTHEERLVPLLNSQIELVTEPTKPSKDEQLLQSLFNLAHEYVVIDSKDSVTWEELEQQKQYIEEIMQLVLGMVRNG